MAEVAGMREFGEFDVVVNIQGDEPFLSREALAGSIGRVTGGEDLGTAAPCSRARRGSEPGQSGVRRAGRAFIFLVPLFHIGAAEGGSDGLYWQHVGIYAFSRPGYYPLAARFRRVRLEQAEQLEQFGPCIMG